VELVIIVALLFLGAAVLYSSVGHGGASAYLAVMALAGIEPLVMRPTALVLNIVVASVAVVRFGRAGQVPLRSLLPFLLGSVPLAFLGGAILLPADFYKLLVGFVLLVAAARLWITAADGGETISLAVPWLPAALAGGVIGLLAGLTGTGGGIFLTRLLLFAAWSSPRPAAGISAGFVLANSVAGLAGNVTGVGLLPAELSLWLPAVLLGAALGTELGVRRFSTTGLRRALSLVLVVAALKLIFIG
jgi:uncharacterized protein